MLRRDYIPYFPTKKKQELAAVTYKHQCGGFGGFGPSKCTRNTQKLFLFNAASKT